VALFDLDVSWMFHGTVRGEIQLLTARRIAGLRIRHVPNHEFEGVAVAPDVPCIEMSADHQRRRVGKAREQFTSRHG
jgi:hypothetical protein